MTIEKAFRSLLIKDLFWGVFCLSLPKRKDDSIGTLGVGLNRFGNAELVFNESFWNSLTDSEQLASLKHELYHIAYQHFFLRKEFEDKEKFNIAADMEINGNIPELPEGVYFPKDYGFENNKGTTYYYKNFNPPTPPSRGGSATGTGSSNKGSHNKWEEFENLSDDQKRIVENQVEKIIMDAAEETEKRNGKIPDDITKIIEDINSKQKKPSVFNWKQYFRRCLGNSYSCETKKTRMRESKRFEDAYGIKRKKNPEILVAIDTSGSINEKEYEDFMNELHYVMKTGCKIHVLECDAKIQYEYDLGKQIPTKIHGGGGTDFQPCIDYFIKHRSKYASLVYFTDGYAPIPNNTPLNVIWIISSDGARKRYPGKTVYIPETNA